MTKIYESYVEFLKRIDKEENGVSKSFAEKYPNWELENEKNKACWNCSDCSDCSDCSGLEWEQDLKGEKEEGGFKVPVVDNIHSKIFEAVSGQGTLEMGQWHSCDTTHCRAGWAVHLAGRVGYKLEKQTSTQFAAMQIFKASSPIKVSPVRFFENNQTAMEDIKRCAEEESKLVKS